MKNLIGVFCVLFASCLWAKEKVILDTDIGADLDDQLAVAYIIQEPECDLLGITTVGSGSNVRAAMVSAICRNAGRDDVKIYPGIEYPLHGGRAGGGPNPPKCAAALAKWPHADFPRGNTAVDFMRQTIRANPGEVTLIAVGHFTNIAILFALDPEIPALLKRFVVMGGNFSGNAEWNAVADPVATSIVYGDGRRPAPPVHLSVGNDVTCKTKIDEAEARAFFKRAKSLAPVADLAEDWLQRRHYAIFHDPLACVCVFHPEVCTYEKVDIVVPPSGESAGYTLKKPTWHNPNPPRRHTVAMDVDRELFFKIYSSVVK